MSKSLGDILVLARHPRLVAASVLSMLVMWWVKFSIGMALADVVPQLDVGFGAMPYFWSDLATVVVGSALGAVVMLSTWFHLARRPDADKLPARARPLARVGRKLFLTAYMAALALCIAMCLLMLYMGITAP